MRVYLDTSVVLRALFNEPGRVPEWGRWEEAYASAIWRVEAARAVDRLRLTNRLTDAQVATLRREIDLVRETLHEVPLTGALLAKAAGAFPTVVGTLDALHLATALAVHEREPLDAVLTHDEQQATAARGLGLAVSGV
jgi:predicted nucleic acid-binding protein